MIRRRRDAIWANAFFAELEDLRGLNERRELERAKQALEAEVLQKDFLLKEVNHRIKNSLQIVSSILHLQSGHTENEEAIKALQNVSPRVLAIAAVHERLYTGSDIRVVHLGPFLTALCSNIADALRPWAFSLRAPDWAALGSLAMGLAESRKPAGES